MTTSDQQYDPVSHYDRVTVAWSLLLGEDLHYGVFEDPEERLGRATKRLTEMMIDALRVEEDSTVLDVGCGIGTPACELARRTGARVVGITTSPEGVRLARVKATALELSSQVTFEERDGMDNGFPDECFDRAWALESSHLMRHRDRLIEEIARVLLPGGRMALCDLVLQKSMDFKTVRRLRRPLSILREAFGDARMEPVGEYRRLLHDAGMEVESEVDLTAATRPTFTWWRRNSDLYRVEVEDVLGSVGWRQFVEACSILERLWDDGILGYVLITGRKP